MNTTNDSNAPIESTRQIVRNMAEQMLRHTSNPAFDPDTAIRQMRWTADIVEDVARRNAERAEGVVR